MSELICIDYWIIPIIGGLLIGFGYLLNSGNKQKIKEQKE